MLPALDQRLGRLDLGMDIGHLRADVELGQVLGDVMVHLIVMIHALAQLIELVEDAGEAPPDVTRRYLAYFAGYPVVFGSHAAKYTTDNPEAYASGMSSDDTTATTDPAPGDAAPGGWGWLDTAGLIAGALLLVMLADILTDGRLISRRLTGRRQQQPENEGVPGDVPAE